MMLREIEPVAEGVLPLAAFKAHLRLSEPEAGGPLDTLLLGQLRAALAAIEARIAKALLQRAFVLRLERWRDADAEALPIAPVRLITAVRLVDRQGTALLVAPELYRLVSDDSRPRLVGTGAALPCVPPQGWAEVEFAAGFAADWAGVPADLAQAVLLLAADYFEFRHEDPGQASIPARVQALIAPWRRLRIIGGGRR